MERTEALGDKESQVEAQVGLARTLTDKDEVKQHHEREVGLYEALGDKVQADALAGEKDQ